MLRNENAKGKTKNAKISITGGKEIKTGQKRAKRETVYKCKICKLADPVDAEGDTIWVQCETCERWYHPDCVGLTQQEVDDDEFSFKCVTCLEMGEE